MPRFKNYFNKKGRHNRIYSLNDLYKMQLGDFMDLEDELDYQDKTIGLPYDDELKASENVRFIDGFTQDDGKVIPSRWESIAPISENQIDNSPFITGGINGDSGIKMTTFPEQEKSTKLSNNDLGSNPVGESLQYEDFKTIGKLLGDILSQQQQNGLQPEQIKQDKNLQMPQEELVNSESLSSSQQEQPQLSRQLRDYIKELVGDNLKNLEGTRTLKGYITNTPEVIESEPTEVKSSEYLDKDGNVHKIDEIKNNTDNSSIFDEIFDKNNKNPIRYQDVKGNWHDSDVENNQTIDETWKYIASAYLAGRVAKNVVKTIPEIIETTNKTVSNIKRSKEMDELKDKRKDWGIAYRKASGNPEQAIETLLEKKQGFVPKAVKDKGGIDFVWGEYKPSREEGKKGGGYGLSHIEGRRNEDGIDGENFLRELADLFKFGKKYKKKNHPGRFYVGNDKKEAAIRTDFNGKLRNWLDSAYFKNKNK